MVAVGRRTGASTIRANSHAVDNSMVDEPVRRLFGLIALVDNSVVDDPGNLPSLCVDRRYIGEVCPHKGVDNNRLIIA